MIRLTRRCLLAILLIVGSLLASAQTTTLLGVEESVHNLSSSGPGTIKSSQDVGVCIFCHAPHNTKTATPMWNRQLPPDNYQLYTSSTYKQTNPTLLSERSKLCLSCHDGTIALGQTVATGDLGIANTLSSSSASYLGTDLRRDHPFGFNMPAVDSGDIKQWLTVSPLVSPDSTVHTYDNKIECVTCHDPHVPNKDSIVSKFLVRSNKQGQLCLVCHDSSRGQLNGWNSSAHAVSTSAIAGSSGLPYATVSDSSCMQCHRSHNAAGTGPRLLRSVEEAACINCHTKTNSVVSPAAPDIATLISNATPYRHPVTDVSGAHDPAETLPVNTTRHAECADCHNPHSTQVDDNSSVPPNVGPPLANVTGLSTSNGSTVFPATTEYQICFKCHANSNNKPQKQGYDQTYGRTVFRQSFTSTTDPFDTSKDFASTISRHNVTQNRRAVSVPSLRPNMLDLAGNPTGPSLTRSNIYCADCHNSNQNRAMGGLGPNGAHGSQWPHILERRYELNIPGVNPGDPVTTVAYSTGTTGPYALCDKCHDVDNLLIKGDTVFKDHRRHVQEAGMACSSCHSSHGVQQTDASHHANLIDPDTSIVAPLSGAADPMINTTTRTCNLVCHGQSHSNKKY